MVSFQCSFGSTDLCLNNGSCSLLTWEGPLDSNGNATVNTFNELGCECPSDGAYIADNVFYHFPSCTLPRDAYLAFLCYYSTMTFLLVFFLVKEFWTISHGKTRQIAVSNVLCLALTWCQVASCFFQSGAFEGNAVFACLSFSVTFYMGGKLSISFMETLHAVRRIPLTRFREALRIATVFASACSFICGLAMIGTCRGPNAAYNLTAWFMELMLIFWIVIFCCIIAYYTQQLLGNVQHASTLRGTTTENKRAIRELIQKVRIIRNCSIYNAILICLVGAPKAIAFLVLGSIPYQWVFGYAFLYQGLIVMSVGILLFVTHTKSKHKKKRQEPGGGRGDGEDDDGNSSRPAEDTNDNVGPMGKKQKEHGMHTDGKNGRTWLFRGSSLMTKQGNKDITKMTYDQDQAAATPGTGGSPRNRKTAAALAVANPVFAAGAGDKTTDDTSTSAPLVNAARTANSGGGGGPV